MGMYYFPGSSAFYTRIQLDSLLEGCFKLSPSITELQFDTAWYNGGVQQIWGLGTALWTMPFEWISWFFGRTCPDALPLFVLLFLLGFYVLRTARRLFEFRGDLGFCSLFAGLREFMRLPVCMGISSRFCCWWGQSDIFSGEREGISIWSVYWQDLLPMSGRHWGSMGCFRQGFAWERYFTGGSGQTGRIGGFGESSFWG